LAHWWRAWNDPALNALVDEALSQNLDVAQAVLRLRQQRLLAGTADAAFRPTVSTGARTLQDIAAVDTYFHASIDVSWDLGLFGDSGGAAGAAGVLDAQAQLHAARVALVADVVHRYLDIRLAQVQRSLAERQLQQAQRQLQLLQIRHEQRLTDAQSLEQQQLQLRTAESQLFTLNEAQARAAHALAALLGRERAEPQWLQPRTMPRCPQCRRLPCCRQTAAQPPRYSKCRGCGGAGCGRGRRVARGALSAADPDGSLLYAYNLTRNHRTTSDSIPWSVRRSIFRS
jgi:outer membrane protein TolC